MLNLSYFFAKRCKPPHSTALQKYSGISLLWVVYGLLATAEVIATHKALALYSPLIDFTTIEVGFITPQDFQSHSNR